MEQAKLFRFDLAKLTDNKVKNDNKDIDDIIQLIIFCKNKTIKKMRNDQLKNNMK